MFGLDPKHFPLAWLPTFMAVNDGLLCWVVRVLRVGHWKKQQNIQVRRKHSYKSAISTTQKYLIIGDQVNLIFI
jgi:hypothetical protein